MLTALLAGGILFIKFKLEALRESVQAQAQTRIGVRLDAGVVNVNGLRGLRIDDFQAAFETPAGVAINVAAGEVYIYIDFIDLLYGKMTVDRIQIDDADIVVQRPEDGQWFTGGARAMLGPHATPAFRVVGGNCRLQVNNVVGGTSLDLQGLTFDISHLADAPDTTARVHGLLGGKPEKRFELNARYSSAEDFDLRLQGGALTAEDLNVFFPATHDFIDSGMATPSLRLAGHPGKTLVLSLEASFTELSVRNRPEFLAPATGTLTVLASYDMDAQLLTLTTAKAQADEIAGRLEGTISFVGEHPGFDLRLDVEQLPVAEILQYALGERFDQYGELKLHIQDPVDFALRLRGTTEAPIISAEARVSAGALSFLSGTPYLPTLDLQLGLMEASWASDRAMPDGTFNITDGRIAHAGTGLEAHKVSGTLVLQEGSLALDPLNAAFAGNALVGKARYDLDTRVAEFSVSGVLANMEATPLADAIYKTTLAGAVNINCTGRLTEDQYDFDLTAECTQAAITHNWWFSKPAGIGGSIYNTHVTIIPKKTLDISAEAALGTSQFSATLALSYDSGRWQLQTARCNSDAVDPVGAGKCLRVPYTISGGTAREGYYEWRRIAGTENDSTARLGGVIDEIALLPKGGEIPVRGKEVRVDATLRRVGEERTADIIITAAEAHLPSLGTRWLLPLRPDDAELNLNYPPLPRTLTYTFACERLEMPPWRATQFAGEAFSDSSQIMLRKYSAHIEGGRIEGSYHLKKADNIGELAAHWTDIPAKYLLQHLHFPDLLTGTMSGGINYTVDQDDRAGTLQGEGFFDIGEGQFSADFLRDQFAEQLEGDRAPLPPSLKFRRFRADVELSADMVKTPKIVLEAEGITVSGEGQFVIQGDMDYSIKVALSPETAQGIPLLRANLNVSGHRITKNDIELGFRITGPSFSPSAKVVALPSVGDTLISGAAEVGSDVGKVIDLPRQILMDIVKIMGGIVGGGN